jgi:hypothetical protein
MLDPRSLEVGGDVRRLVLGVAFAFGLAFAAAPHTGSVRAAGLQQTIVAQADTSKGANAAANGAAAKATAKGSAAKSAANGAAAAANAPSTDDTPKADAANADNADADDADTDTDDDTASKGSRRPGNHGIFIDKGGKRIRIEGLGNDREYNSFNEFVEKAPLLAGMFFVTLMVIFLLPLLVVVLLIWYKLRKNRLANETMLKLAERGVVPPATAMDAVASGTAASVAAAATPPPGVPAYEQARYLRRRAVWSDLRKGVILCAIGLGLSFWSILDDGTPNSVGLVLLFVGIGYCVLWFFEDRTTTSAREAGAPPPGSA